MRNFGKDFCLPATKNLNKKNACVVGIALDAAILFGILEYIDGNAWSKLSKETLQELYDEKVARLASLSS
jgi:hypothetical protein